MSLKKEQREEITNFILWNIRDHPSDIVGVTQRKFGVSRPAILRYIHNLISDHKIDVEGSTRGRKYSLRSLQHIGRTYRIQDGLAEDKVWREDVATLFKGVKENMLGIAHYGFTEIFNNAIDHSEGTEIEVDVEIWIDQIIISISDNGVGIFNKIKQKFNLDDPLHAILELAKGKLTTEPQSHTGEGIFFTSRMFDLFVILSGKLSFVYGDDLEVLSEQEEDYKGTSVVMKVSTNSERTTNSVFSRFTSQELGFNKTIVPVKLASYENENLISRSQAKRLLARLDRFRYVVLDFADVHQIGRAFADEIFRVFVNAHPGTTIVPLHHDNAIAHLIKEIQSNNNKEAAPVNNKKTSRK